MDSEVRREKRKKERKDEATSTAAAGMQANPKNLMMRTVQQQQLPRSEDRRPALPLPED